MNCAKLGAHRATCRISQTGVLSTVNPLRALISKSASFFFDIFGTTELRLASDDTLSPLSKEGAPNAEHSNTSFIISRYASNVAQDRVIVATFGGYRPLKHQHFKVI